MMKTPNLSRTCHLLPVLIALLGSSALALALSGRAEVKRVTGSATLTSNVGATSALVPGMVVRTGDTVSTSPGSSVDLWLGINGDGLRLDPDTILRFDMLEISNISERHFTTSMNLIQGSVTGNVAHKLSSASKYEVKSAAGTADIRGTIYAFRHDGTLVVLEGVVNFTYVRNGVSRTVRVGAGQQFKPGDENPTAASEQLLAKISRVAQQISPESLTVVANGLTVTKTTIENPADVSTSAR